MAPLPSLILYFIADNPSTEHSRDLFTWAATPDEAVADWQTYFETHDRPQGLCSIPTNNPTRGAIPWSAIRTEALP